MKAKYIRHTFLDLDVIKTDDGKYYALSDKKWNGEYYEAWECLPDSGVGIAGGDTVKAYPIVKGDPETEVNLETVGYDIR